MNTRHNALLLPLIAAASLAMSLPAYADRDDHRGRHHDRGGHYDNRYDNNGGKHHGRGHGHGKHKWRGHPLREVHHYYHERPRRVYHHYAPPRYGYYAHGVYGYHEHCSHGHDYGYAPYGSGLSLWLDGIGFSYYERGW